jgi:hypothetical protein
MGKERTGCIVKKYGVLYARVTYRDSAGKRKEIARVAANKTEARKILKQLLQATEASPQTIEQRIEGDRMTFNQFANIYTEHKLVAPQYRNDRKISGYAAGRDSLVF